MRGLFWSSMGILALLVAGYLVAGIVYPEHVTPTFRARWRALYMYASLASGGSPPPLPPGDRACAGVVVVDANDPVETLTTPKTFAVCEGIG